MYQGISLTPSYLVNRFFALLWLLYHILIHPNEHLFPLLYQSYYSRCDLHNNRDNNTSFRRSPLGAGGGAGVSYNTDEKLLTSMQRFRFPPPFLIVELEEFREEDDENTPGLMDMYIFSRSRCKSGCLSYLPVSTSYLCPSCPLPFIDGRPRLILVFVSYLIISFALSSQYT